MSHIRTPEELHRYADLLAEESNPWANFVRDAAYSLEACIAERDALQKKFGRTLAVAQHARHYVAMHLDTDADAADVIQEIVDLAGGPD